MPYKKIKTSIKKGKTSVEVFENTKHLNLAVPCVSIEQ